MTDANQPSSSQAAFELLHPSVQRQLWNMHWESLRPLQSASTREILTTTNHVILSAPTAAGKTEAAFLPILSDIAMDTQHSVRALYVGPLKALINDQFTRLGELCTLLETPVHSWHGDIGSNKKTKLIADPGGILLITPESIESLFVNHPGQLSRVFRYLKYIVIDELHTFLGNERGLHLRSLLTRLISMAETPVSVRLVGLSATIGNVDMAKSYVSPGYPERVTVIEDTAGHKELKLRVHSYVSEPLPANIDPSQELPDDAFDLLVSDIVKHCHGAANLVFANSRADVELIGEACRQHGKLLGFSDQFLVHHGSLSADIRRDAETTMKQGSIATTFCTPTLELGIDIGSVRMVGQVDPPWSIASLKQRLGRSGRRTGESQILRMYVREAQAAPTGNLFDRLHLDLIRAIATTELLVSGWVEPATPLTFDLSTLTHQVISAIGELGGRSATDLYQLLCVKGPFRDINAACFSRLLRQLGKQDVVEQMPEGDLILGRVGERIYRHFTFYAVFQTPEQYTLIHESERLGTLDVVPESGQHLVFAARRWLVTDVDNERHEIHVVPARGRRKTAFGGRSGMLHPRIVQKMREVLLSTNVPSYLDEAGHILLDQSRQAAQEADIAHKHILRLSEKKSCLLTWGGTRINRTLMAMMITLDIHPRDELIGLELPMPEENVPSLTSELCRHNFNPEHLALTVQDQLPSSKYDWLIGPELVALRHANQFVDISAAKSVIASML